MTSCLRALTLLLALFQLPVAALAQDLVPYGSTWRFLDDGSDPGPAWTALGFPDDPVDGWGAGPAELGYGDGDEATLVASGPTGTHHATTYFRHTFSVTDPGAIAGLTARLIRDDGAAVHLNGVEVYRNNLPAGPIDSSTFANAVVGAADETSPQQFPVDPTLLVPGDNVLAVEIHQSSATSSDISFDLRLFPAAGEPPLERAPYLMMGTPTSMVVRWRTTFPRESVLRTGIAPGLLTTSYVDPVPKTDHEIPVSGLSPGSTVYYAVGTTTETYAGDDLDHYFVTSPAGTPPDPIRLWVIGDSGACASNTQGCLDATAVMDEYLDFVGPDLADVWLLLGDNAYASGTDEEYTAGFFDVYPQVMRNTVVWPAPGNHEFGASDSPTQNGPYYEAFTMPTAAEAGGVPSGSEAYYSFDYGNIHVVVLDSHDTSRAAPPDAETNVCPTVPAGGAMYNWLCEDLAATDKDFVIATWHHPPYSKGSHNSDACNGEFAMCEMRKRFVPVLEHFGVDVQLTGHSHSYERSYLIDGNYGDSSECAAGECMIDWGDGDPESDGPYEKPTLGPAPHEGTVYAVVGSSSKDSGTLSSHPVMHVGVNDEGSLLLEVHGRRLDGTMIDKDGLVRDRFQILKGPEVPHCSDGLDNDGDGLVDHPDDPGCRMASSMLEAPECNDGLDNDSDLAVDFPADSLCRSAWDDDEATNPAVGCGLGPEVALALAALLETRRRRTRRA